MRDDYLAGALPMTVASMQGRESANRLLLRESIACVREGSVGLTVAYFSGSEQTFAWFVVCSFFFWKLTGGCGTSI